MVCRNQTVNYNIMFSLKTKYENLVYNMPWFPWKWTNPIEYAVGVAKRRYYRLCKNIIRRRSRLYLRTF